jgi:excisionase family DNA binding protein
MSADPRGHTVRELAKVLRVSPDKVRGWIARGELGAINTAAARCGKPRYVILPHHLAEFEGRHAAAQPAEPVRRKRRTVAVDYYPD